MASASTLLGLTTTASRADECFATSRSALLSVVFDIMVDVDLCRTDALCPAGVLCPADTLGRAQVLCIVTNVVKSPSVIVMVIAGSMQPCSRV